MGRNRRTAAVAVAASLLGWLLLAGPLSPWRPPSQAPETAAVSRPVEFMGPPPANRAGVQHLERIVVPTHLREPSAGYDRSLLPDDLSRIRPMDPSGPVSRRPRGLGAQGPTPRFAEVMEHPAQIAADPKPARSVKSTHSAGQVVQVIEATDFNHNQLNTDGGLFVPPDTYGAAGPSHLVSVTNVTVRFYQKDGSLLYDSSLKDFFSGFSPPTHTFDPRVVYDHFAGRFVLITTELTDTQFGFPSDTAHIYVAVSDDSDPTGTWYQTAMDVKLSFFNDSLGFTTHHWIDFPCLAVGEDALYIHAKAVSNFTTGGVVGGFRLFVLDKQLGRGGLYDGGALASAVYDPYVGGAGFAVTAQPAQIFGSPGADVGTYLVSYSGLSDGTNEFVQVVRVKDPLGAVSFEPQLVDVGDIDVFSGGLPDATQMGTTARVDTNARPALKTVWRNDTLWATSHVAGRAGTADAGQVSAHWFQLDAGPTGSVTLADQGDISGEDIGSGTFTFFPSIAVNERNEAVIGFSASGPEIYPSAYAALRMPDDPPGTTGPSLLVREGVSFYIRTLGSANRWGDYSSVAVDPVDQCFWVHNQYAKLQGTFLNDEGGRWATAFGRVCAFECGNGTQESPEDCDDGNAIDGDACSNTCEVNACGAVDTDGDRLGDGCDPDDDNDGVFDPDDCAPLNAEAAIDPVPVTQLRFDGAGQIVWASQAAAIYDVASGALSDLRKAGVASAVCLVDDTGQPETPDSQPDPAEGSGYYFIVRAQNACGDGGYGIATGGVPRQPTAACP